MVKFKIMGQDDVPEATEEIKKICKNVEEVIVGKPHVVKMAIVCLLSQGHLLIEDIPGVGKTMLARAIAKSVAGLFRRIQFAPDLLPSDITGVSVYDQGSRDFQFKPGPIFGNIILADEINRATPRTQSSLLEAMSEYQVTVDGISHQLHQPFFVIATENPLEEEGVYPLLVSQLDRFTMKLTIGYPLKDEEKKIITDQKEEHPIERLQAVTSGDEILRLQNLVRTVRLDDSLNDYLVNIVNATRQSPQLRLGSSPRASLHLYRASQALALFNARDYCLPDDIKELASSVLSHRLIKGSGYSKGGQEEIVREILDSLPVPL